MDKIINAYLYILDDDGVITEYHGKVCIPYSRGIFHEDNGKELPHFGKVANKEGLVCFDSIWFEDKKTDDFVKKEFIRNYERSIKYAKQRLDNLEAKLKSLEDAYEKET